MKTKLSLLVLLGMIVLGSEAHARVLVATNSTWRYFKGTAEASTPTNAWRELAFDDSAWLTGAAPFHYGTNAVGGDDNLTNGTLLTDMRSGYTCVFLRQTFVITDTNRLLGLRLNLWFDDGFAVWINGQLPRAPVNLSGRAYTNRANSSREGTRTSTTIDTAIALLRNGNNVICLQGFNVGIADDDFRVEAELTEIPTTLAFASATTTVVEGTTQSVVRVTRTGPLDAGSTVDFATTNGTALTGEDYLATSGTLVFAEGQVEQSIVVPILNDGSRESREAFQIRLINPGGGAVLGSSTLTTVLIDDNDPGFQVEFANYYGHENAGPVVVAVLRGNDGDFPATVDFATADGVALAGSDYVATNGMLTFAAGEQLKLVPIAILNDGTREGRETFTFSLQNAFSEVGLGTLVRATNTIFESDQGVRFERTVHAVHEFEGELHLTVLRGNDADLEPFTVGFSSSNLTAIAGVDYVGTNGTLEFAEGEMTSSITVRILDDEVLELDKTFRVVLGPLSGAAVLGAPTNTTAIVTVCDDTGRQPHRCGSLSVSSDGTVRLTPEGGVSPRFASFFDLYPVEVSSNLVDWTPLVTLVRTNASTNALIYVESGAVGIRSRFYRLAATNLVAPVLQPTGPYAVGRVDRKLTDPARRNRYAISTNGSFMVSIWYPAVAEAGRLPMPFDDPVEMRDPLWTDDPSRHIYWLARAAWFFTHATADLRLLEGSDTYPVVLLSHGANGVRNDIQHYGEDLASHGYVAIGVDHYDAWSAVYPDGTYVFGPEARDTHTFAGLRDRVADLGFVVDQLEQWNRSDPLLAGRLNLKAIAAGGHSWGGSTAGEFCRTDARCQAAISLDGGWWDIVPELVERGLQKPSLTINTTGNLDETLFSLAVTNAYFFQVRDVFHLDFLSAYWWFGVDFIPPAQELTRIVRGYEVSFLNKYLKGQDDHLLDGPPGARFPRVTNFKKK